MSSIRSPKSADRDLSYQHLKGQKIPDISLAITSLSQPISLQRALPKRYVLVVQPGPSTSKCILPSNWATIKGAPGCTGEAQGFNKLLDKFIDAGFGVFLLNNKSHQVQKIAKQEKFLNIDFLSDENFLFANALGLEVREVPNRMTDSKMKYLDRVTLIVEDGIIQDVIDHITAPSKNAEITLERLPKLDFSEKASQEVESKSELSFK